MIDEMNNWNRKVEHIAGICEYEIWRGCRQYI